LSLFIQKKSYLCLTSEFLIVFLMRNTQIFKVVVFLMVVTYSGHCFSQLKPIWNRNHGGGTSGKKTNKLVRKLKKTTWTIGVSGVVIDDDGKPFTNLFNMVDSWTYLPYPTKLTVEGYLDHGFSVEGSFAYTVLKEGKIYNDFGLKRPEDARFFAYDLNVKFFLNEILGRNKVLGPYAIGGLGYTYRALSGQGLGINANIGFGLNIWVYKGLGLNLQSMAKFAIDKNSSNYLQHSAGLVYRFNFISPQRISNGKMSRRYDLFGHQPGGR
jgi:hypothetical protein